MNLVEAPKPVPIEVVNRLTDSQQFALAAISEAGGFVVSKFIESLEIERPLRRILSHSDIQTWVETRCKERFSEYKQLPQVSLGDIEEAIVAYSENASNFGLQMGSIESLVKILLIPTICAIGEESLIDRVTNNREDIVSISFSAFKAIQKGYQK